MYMGFSFYLLIIDFCIKNSSFVASKNLIRCSINVGMGAMSFILFFDDTYSKK